MSEQLPLTGLRPSAVTVDPRAVRRHARKMLGGWLRDRSAGVGFAALAYFTDVALLDEMRERYREILRDCKRAARAEGASLRAGRAAVQLAASPEGRRVHRAIEEVTERVQTWEQNVLCG